MEETYLSSLPRTLTSELAKYDPDTAAALEVITGLDQKNLIWYKHFVDRYVGGNKSVEKYNPNSNYRERFDKLKKSEKEGLNVVDAEDLDHVYFFYYFIKEKDMVKLVSKGTSHRLLKHYIKNGRVGVIDALIILAPPGLMTIMVKYAYKFGQKKIIQLLLDNGSTPSSSNIIDLFRSPASEDDIIEILEMHQGGLPPQQTRGYIFIALTRGMERVADWLKRNGYTAIGFEWGMFEGYSKLWEYQTLEENGFDVRRPAGSATDFSQYVLDNYDEYNDSDREALLFAIDIVSDVNQLSKDRSPLLPQFLDDAEIIEKLLGAGMNPDEGYPLLDAVDLSEPITSLEKKGTTDDDREQVHRLMAIRFNVVKTLVESGADVNVRSSSGRTLLMIPTSTEIFKYLLSLGRIDVEAIDADGQTMLHLLDLDRYHTEINNVKMKLGLNINQQSALGNTPLMSCINKFHHKVGWKGNSANASKVLSLLIENGADVNLSSLGGMTPLMKIVESEEIALIKLLLDNGADNELRDAEGFTSEWYVRSSPNRDKIVKLIRSYPSTHYTKKSIQDIPSSLECAILSFNYDRLYQLSMAKRSMNTPMRDGTIPLRYLLELDGKAVSPFEKDQVVRMIGTMAEVDNNYPELLYLAIVNGWSKMIPILINDRNIVDEGGIALGLAVKENDDEAFFSLIQAGVDTDITIDDIPFDQYVLKNGTERMIEYMG